MSIRDILPLLVLVSCVARSDYTLDSLVKEIGAKGTVIKRPASAFDLIGLQAFESGIGNSILRRDSRFVSRDKSFTTRELTYSSKAGFSLDFSYYVSVGAQAADGMTGKAMLKDVFVDRIKDPVPDIQSAVLRDALREGSVEKTFTVYQDQIRAGELEFSGDTVKSWGLKAKPDGAIKGVDVALEASGKINVKGKGTGTGLVLGATPKKVSIGKVTTSKESGRSARVENYSFRLEEQIERGQKEFKVSVTAPFLEVNLTGDWDAYLEIHAQSGSATFLIVHKIAVGHYRFSLVTFTAKWLDM